MVGCTDDIACNFNTDATDDDDSCTYAEEYYDCDGICVNDEDADGVCDELEGMLRCLQGVCFPSHVTYTYHLFYAISLPF